MSHEIYVGILVQNAQLNVTTLDTMNQKSLSMTFPSTHFGIEAIHTLLKRYCQAAHLAIAIAGIKSLELALTLQALINTQIFIVSSHCANQAKDLAVYAKHAA